MSHIYLMYSMFLFSDLLYDLLPIFYNIFITTNQFLIWCLHFLKPTTYIYYLMIFWYILISYQPGTWNRFLVYLGKYQNFAAMSSLFSMGEAAMLQGELQKSSQGVGSFIWKRIKPPKFNMAPENRPSPQKGNFQSSNFQPVSGANC